MSKQVQDVRYEKVNGKTYIYSLMMKRRHLQVIRPLETVQDHFDAVTEPIDHRLGRILKMVTFSGALEKSNLEKLH